jgi:hypothetical protein
MLWKSDLSVPPPVCLSSSCGFARLNAQTLAQAPNPKVLPKTHTSPCATIERARGEAALDSAAACCGSMQGVVWLPSRRGLLRSLLQPLIEGPTWCDACRAIAAAFRGKKGCVVVLASKHGAHATRPCPCTLRWRVPRLHRRCSTTGAPSSEATDDVTQPLGAVHEPQHQRQPEVPATLRQKMSAAARGEESRAALRPDGDLAHALAWLVRGTAAAEGASVGASGQQHEPRAPPPSPAAAALLARVARLHMTQAMKAAQAASTVRTLGLVEEAGTAVVGRAARPWQWSDGRHSGGTGGDSSNISTQVTGPGARGGVSLPLQLPATSVPHQPAAPPTSVPSLSLPLPPLCPLPSGAVRVHACPCPLSLPAHAPTRLNIVVAPSGRCCPCPLSRGHSLR